jgi:hypothetical protein
MGGHMQKLIKAFENMMVAITFAEAGEYDEAQKLSIHDQKEEASEVNASLNIKATKA